MYVCICNALRCRDVKEAAGKGASRASDVFQHFSVKPQCGRCVSTMRGMLPAGGSTTAKAAASGVVDN